jgi:hypothetical protein
VAAPFSRRTRSTWQSAKIFAPALHAVAAADAALPGLHHALSRVAGLRGAGLEEAVHRVQAGVFGGVNVEVLLDALEVRQQLVVGVAFEAELALPLLEAIFRRAPGVGPVVHRGAADVVAVGERELAVGAGVEAAAAVDAREHVVFALIEVAALGEVEAAALDHQHRLAGLRELFGDHRSAAAGADDDGVDLFGHRALHARVLEHLGLQRGVHQPSLESASGALREIPCGPA